jgi:hypothetical protein
MGWGDVGGDQMMAVMAVGWQWGGVGLYVYLSFCVVYLSDDHRVVVWFWDWVLTVV